MAKIIVEINCDGEKCGRCMFKYIGTRNGVLEYCKIFRGQSLWPADNPERLPECIAAETE
jgi:hypothetical protein